MARHRSLLRSLLACAAALLGSGAATASEALDLLRAANESFAEGVRLEAEGSEGSSAAFERAAAAYRGALAVGEGDLPLVQFNLGTALLLGGDVGGAVLALRRAARGAPGDERIARNLGAARQRVRTQVAAEAERSALERLAFWRGAIGQEARFLLAIALVNLGVVVGFARVAGVRRFGPVWLGWTCALLGLVSGGTLAVDAAMVDADAAVVMEARTGRTGPGERVYDASFTSPVAEGVEVTILESRSGWARVRLRDGRETWLPEDALERV
jgi:tetratricopeptide (TPR) repeat protein